MLLAAFAGSSLQAAKSERSDISSVVTQSSDLGRVKITLDSAVIGDASSRVVLRQINVLAMAAKGLAGPTAGFREKMAAVRRVIYEPGPWNEHRPFHYDLADPLGSKIENKLLSTYLRTRRGNCVSMPVLFVILAQRLGIDATLAVAPLHVFVKVTDPAGREWNVEATDGANAMRTDWYRQKFGISEKAIESGIYMRKLSSLEAAALLANVVVEKLLADGRYQEAVTAAGQILAVSPCDIHAMLQQGTAYARLLETEFDARYQNPETIPQALRPRWQMLVDGNRRAFARAEELGWTPAP